MIDASDFPLTCYGCAVFTAQNPVPFVVMSSPAIAVELVRRLNEGELAAMICDAVMTEETAAGRHDGAVAAERCARLIRGRQRDQDAETMKAAGAVAAAPEDTGGWSLDGAVNDGKPPS